MNTQIEKFPHLTPDFFPFPNEIPDRFRLDRYAGGRRYLVGGQVKEWKGPTRPVFSPVCLRKGESDLEPHEIGEYPLLSKKEAMDALHAAEQAWGAGAGDWSTASMSERIEQTRAFVSAMRQCREEVALLEMWEIGKPYADCLKEFDRTVEYIEETISELETLKKDTSELKVAGGVAGSIRRAPLGPVLCMGPYNYPLNESFTILIPAIAMGNPVIVKLPRYGMLCNLPLLEAFVNCFPPGVVNVINGDGPTVIQPIMETGRINALAFIGSSRTANSIERYHPRPNRLRRVFGLEAKNSGVVFKCADISKAVHECVVGALSFDGQRCTALKQIWVEESVAEAFLEGLADQVNQLPAGMPWEEGVRITPLPEAHKVDYLVDLVKDALRKGARIVNPGGGEHIGTFFKPAILFPVTTNMRIYQEEQFGPIIPVTPFRDEREVLLEIEASDYGQQISLFGQDPMRLGRLIDPLTNLVARINLNAQCQRGPDVFPFTGRKDSAIGTLSIYDALRSFSLRSMVAISEQEAGLLTDLPKNGNSRFLA